MKSERRLIDADALIKHLGEEPMVWCDGEAEIQERDDWRRFKAYIEAQDTIDAVEVVRCRDCKHFTEGMAVGMCKRIPDKPIIPMPYNAFCAFGERKEQDA